MSATVHDVARLAGVSIITVSRVLNAPDKVAAATRERVEQAIAATHYVPNLMAGSLRSAKSRLVVALVPTLSSPLFAPAIAALTAALEAHGVQLMLGQLGYADSREERIVDAVIGRRPDGIVLTGIDHARAVRERLVASRIPVVETWDHTPTPIDMLVGFSHEKIGPAVCDFLVRRGRRRLALVSADDARALRRRDGYLRAAAAAGLPPPHVEVVPAPATHASGRAALPRLLAAMPDADAVFCSSDALAHGLCTEAAARGIAVPGRLAVVGFGDLDIAASLEPSLSSVRIDAEALGRRVASLLVARSREEPVEEPVVDIGFSIVERASTRGA